MEEDILVHRGPEQNKSKLFLINKVAAAAGVSRSTILRMEERGLLKPAYVAPSGLRYYDTYNLSRVMEIQRFQAMGFSSEETLLYFTSGGDADGLLTLVEEKLQMLRFTYEEMKLRDLDEDCQTVELVRLASADYYVERGLCATPQERNDLAYNAYHNCVDKGYALAPKPLMLIHECEDFLVGGFPSGAYQHASCTPVRPGQKGAEIETLSGGNALMMLFCGNFRQLNESYIRIVREAKERGLTPAGYIRSIWVVGPYTGRELTPNKYRARILLPVDVPTEDGTRQ